MPAPGRARRSSKAGRPPADPITSARVRRRTKTAHASFRKGGTLLQASEGPRVVWGVQKPQVKKGRLRARAMKRGLKISEYGVFRATTGRRVAGATEEEVYAAVGLPWIPPELREDRGEIEAASAGTLPDLVTLADVRGDLHCHTNASDGQHSVEALAVATARRGWVEKSAVVNTWPNEKLVAWLAERRGDRARRALA